MRIKLSCIYPLYTSSSVLMVLHSSSGSPKCCLNNLLSVIACKRVCGHMQIDKGYCTISMMHAHCTYVYCNEDKQWLTPACALAMYQLAAAIFVVHVHWCCVQNLEKFMNGCEGLLLL